MWSIMASFMLYVVDKYAGISTWTSVQAGAVLMPLAMFLLSLKSIRVLSIMNFILKLAYLYKVTEKKRLIYMHLL